MKRQISRWAIVPVVAVIILVLDQWTKGWIEQNIALGGTIVPFAGLARWFKLWHITNTGAAFGLLQGQSGLFAIIAIVVIVAVLVYVRQLPTEKWPIRALLGLQLGGAAGNLMDRLQHGQVTDFLYFTLPVGDKVYQWPAFNVADMSIVCGVILLAILLLRSESGAAPEQQRQPEGQEP